MLTLTTAPFSRRFTICHSAASETLGWANIMVNGDSAHIQTRAESCRIARRSTSVACATRPTTTIGSYAKLSCQGDCLLKRCGTLTQRFAPTASEEYRQPMAES